MPMAVIVDDRADVWQAEHLPQLVRANAFQHYETAAKALVSPGREQTVDQRGLAESKRLLAFLQGIRKDQFLFWEQFVLPVAELLVGQGVPNAFWALDMMRMFARCAYVNHSGHSRETAPLPAAMSEIGCASLACKRWRNLFVFSSESC